MAPLQLPHLTMARMDHSKESKSRAAGLYQALRAIRGWGG
jgi:hypothetical protein